VASRKEEQQRRRAERLAAEQRESQAAQRRLMAGYIVAGGLALAVVVGLVIVLTSGGGNGGSQDSGDFPEEAHVQVFSGTTDGLSTDDREGTPPPAVANGDLEAAAEEAGCELDLDLPDEGSSHFTDENKKQDYTTNPPTSGDHYGVPTETASGAMADGAYSEPPIASRLVHSLEHGRVEIQYSPDLSNDEQLELKGVFDEEPAGVLLFPNPDMPYDVAVTAWTQMATCDTYAGAATLDMIRAFRDIYRGQGPEPVPLVTG